MSAEWQEYVIDPRPVCKYGIKCYQKNVQHHNNFKHPPRNVKRRKDSKNVENKRFKPQESEKQDLKVETNETALGVSENKLEESCSTSSGQSEIQSSNNADENKIVLPKDLMFYDESVDTKDLIKSLFLVDMPSDFYIFFEKLKANGSIDETLAAVNLELIGPYDLLLGKLPIIEDKELYLVHWRFFYDPPEFQAIMKCKGKSQLHFGYFRDNPNEAPEFVASNDSEKDCKITPISYNVFGAVYTYLQNQKQRSPFVSVACQKLMEKVKKWAESENFSLEKFDVKKRQSKIVTKTFHGAGIVVPYDKKTQLGYRPLVENDQNIKKIFAKIENAQQQTDKDKALSELQPVISYASIAMDESDFGTGLEIGINLFCSGLTILKQSTIVSLSTAYSLLQRDAYIAILKAHLKYRRKGSNMSLLK